ncbi:hypothetical protein AKO1_006607 [Acrasis kona]|uniref:Helicase C-terminal domain-containing protein n=1 Tax=Acrasis kona TaxID=1008807 RepID=A0AAW2ZNJ0_9EUKA
MQMIGDSERGSTWTSVLLGIQAREIHLCGDPTAIPIVEKLCAQMGEQVMVNRYERMTPLHVEKNSLNEDITQIRDRDCVVAFSRKDLYSIKRLIETEIDKKCCIIYGSLPSRVRSEQAEMFNDRTSGYNVLVASNAIGMGLNLDIERVVFFKTKMFRKGQGNRKMDLSLCRQVAGRAGRRGFYKNGLVTTFSGDNLNYVKYCVELKPDAIPNIVKAGLYPDFNMLQKFANKTYPGEQPKLHVVLKQFVALSSINDDFFMCNQEDNITLSEAIQGLNMSFKEQFTFSRAPAQVYVERCMDSFMNYAKEFCSSNYILIPIGISEEDLHNRMKLFEEAIDLIKNLSNEQQEIQSEVIEPILNDLSRYSYDFEDDNRVILLYQWLAQRYPLRFDAPLATRMSNLVSDYIMRVFQLQTNHNLLSAKKTRPIEKRKQFAERRQFAEKKNVDNAEPQSRKFANKKFTDELDKLFIEGRSKFIKK